MEVEAKFSIPDRATFERLCKLDELAGYRLQPAGIEKIHDRYLDTDDRRILQAGYACRVRRKGPSLKPIEDPAGERREGETWVATLKGLGGAEAESGIHQREEYEAPVEGVDPATWPASAVRDLTLELCGGRPLVELVSLSQERHVRLLFDDAPEGGRQIAELSLDVVTPGGQRSCSYYELEIELLDQGDEPKLQTLAHELNTSWSLHPESRSKFERGLAAIDEDANSDRRGTAMKESLTTEERAALQIWREAGNRPEQRRAYILLLQDEGLGTSAIAEEVGLSRRQVRRWLAAFRDKRLGVFPTKPRSRGRTEEDSAAQGEPLIMAEAADVSPEVGPREPEPPTPLSVEELCRLHSVDMDRANHVRDLALRLFDLIAEANQISPDHRSLLEAAATLHTLGLEQDAERYHLSGRDLILAQPVAGFEPIEQDMLASIVAFHRKKVRRDREEAFVRLPSSVQRDTLALASLLRMAAGLDDSMTQSTSVDRAEVHDGRQIIVVAGPKAEQDADVAQRRSKLWHRLFDTTVSFMTEEQLARESLFIQLGAETFLLPELDAPGLLPDDPMSEAGRKTLWFHFLRMLKHEPGTRAGEDIEELHDMRVATRRMRAAVRVFGDFMDPNVIKPFNKEVRRVTRALGPVRDLDVFEEKAGHYLSALPEEARDGLDPLIESWHKERETAREEMLAYLDSPRYHRFKREFADFLQTKGAGARPLPRDRPVAYKVRHVAPRLIYTRYEAVRAYETVLENAQIETLHALRIDCKYLRYTLEFLREVLDPEGEKVIKEVKAMQDHLGDLNDADVAIRLLNEFLRDWDAVQTAVPLNQRRSVEGVVNYLAARHAEKHRLLTTFPQAWDTFNREEVRRWLALAVAAL